MRRLIALVFTALLAFGATSYAVGLYDMAWMTVSGAPGTATITLGSALPGYISFAAAGVADGEIVSYHIQDGANWENDRAAYHSSGTTLSRGLVASSSGSLINASSSATVFITELASDIVSTHYPSAIVTRVAETPCVVSGTSGTLTLDLSICGGTASPDNFHIGPLTGATTIVFTNPIPGQRFTLEIAANTQTVTLPACKGPPLTAVAGDSFIVYDVFDATPTYWCPAGVQASLTLPAIYNIVSVGHGSNCANLATCTGPSLQSVTTGTNILVHVFWCGHTGSACTGSGTTSTTAAVPTKSAGTATIGTCAALTGATASETTSAFVMAAYQCPVTGTGTLTMTDTLGGTVPHAMELSIADVSGLNSTPDLDAIGNGAPGTTSVTATTTGNTSQSSEFISAAGSGTAFNQGSPGSGYTALDSDNTGIQFLTEYKTSGAAGSTQSATLTAASGTSIAIISALAHP